MKYINKIICSIIITSASILLYGCKKDGAWRFWHKFECTINNIPYFDNPEVFLPWQSYTPNMDYYSNYDGSSQLIFYSSLVPKDDTKEWPQYDVRCTIWNFTPDMINKKLTFSIPPETEDIFLHRTSYLEITNMQTWNTCFGEGYMIISSYDETQNEMFGKLRAETKDIGDNACKPLILEGNFQVIVEKHQ